MSIHMLTLKQATLTTVQLTQREVRWLQVLHSRPTFAATNSRKDMQQWTELIVATMPMEMQKWMAMVLNLSEVTGVSGATTFPTPAVYQNPVEGNVSAPPRDSVEAFTLSSGQNDEASGPYDKVLTSWRCGSISSMNNLLDLLIAMNSVLCRHTVHDQVVACSRW
jgi:hypothetical protein